MILIVILYTMYICLCNAITESQIRQAVDLGATTLGELGEGLGVGENCGKCKGCACDILNDALARAPCAA
jgi:bacterioferritin-associated ferredoxin